jgi:hypothetical protein
MLQINLDNLPGKMIYTQELLSEMVYNQKGTSIAKAAMFENIAFRKKKQNTSMLLGESVEASKSHNFAAVLVIFEDPVTKLLHHLAFPNFSQGLKNDGENHAEQRAWNDAKKGMKAHIRRGVKIKKIAIASDLSLCIDPTYKNTCDVYFSMGGGATTGNAQQMLVFDPIRDKICYSIQGSLEDVKERIEESTQPETMQQLQETLIKLKKNQTENLKKIQNGEDKTGSFRRSNERLPSTIKAYEEKIKNFHEAESKNEVVNPIGFQAKPAIDVNARNAVFENTLGKKVEDFHKKPTDSVSSNETNPQVGKLMLPISELKNQSSQEKDNDKNEELQDMPDSKSLLNKPK